MTKRLYLHSQLSYNKEYKKLACFPGNKNYPKISELSVLPIDSFKKANLKMHGLRNYKFLFSELFHRLAYDQCVKELREKNTFNICVSKKLFIEFNKYTNYWIMLLLDYANK